MSRFTNPNALETDSMIQRLSARKTADEPLNLLSLSGSAKENERKNSTEKPSESLLSQAKPAKATPPGGIGNVTIQIGKGMVDQVANHPGELVFNGLLGAGAAGVFRVGMKVARVPTLGAAIAGGAYMLYDLASQAPKFGRDLATTYDPSGRSAAEIKAAENGLQSFGRGSLNFAAGGLGVAPGNRLGSRFLESQTGKRLTTWAESNGYAPAQSVATSVNYTDKILARRENTSKASNTNPLAAETAAKPLEPTKISKPQQFEADDTLRSLAPPDAIKTVLAIENDTALQAYLKRDVKPLLQLEGSESLSSASLRIWRQRTHLADRTFDFIPANEMRITAANARAKLLEPFTNNSAVTSKERVTEALRNVELADDVLKLGFFTKEERALMQASVQSKSVQKELVSAFQTSQKQQRELAFRKDTFERLKGFDAPLFAADDTGPSTFSVVKKALMADRAIGEAERRGIFSIAESNLLHEFDSFLYAAKREGIDSSQSVFKKLREKFEK